MSNTFYFSVKAIACSLSRDEHWLRMNGLTSKGKEHTEASKTR